MNLNFIIIGGQGAGLSASSAIKRNLPDTNVTVIEKSKYISSSICGAHYYLNDKINNINQLTNFTVDSIKQKRDINVIINSEVIDIDTRKKNITFKNINNSELSCLPYDKLLISTGAQPVIPKINGIEKINYSTLRNLEDAENLKNKFKQYQNFTIIGAGILGLGLAEDLTNRNKSITFVENKKLLSDFTEHVSNTVEKILIKNNIIIKYDDISEIISDSHNITLHLSSTEKISTEHIILTCGVKPNIELAEKAGITIGKTGAIETDRKMKTNKFNIYAAGDCAETTHLISNKKYYFPLATTANKQGRIAGKNMSGENEIFKGILGTVIFKIFNCEISRTGLTEKELKKYNIKYDVQTIFSKSKSGYNPKSDECSVTLLYRKTNNQILGAELTGPIGFGKKIDVLATAIYNKMKINDFKYLDFGYYSETAPVWDPLLIAANVIK